VSLNAEEWLHSVGSDGRSVISRFAELAEVNGGIQPRGSTTMPIPGGAYGRHGLTESESVELIYLNGYLNGLLAAHGQDAKDVMVRIEREILAAMAAEVRLQRAREAVESEAHP
jgi:hypothetical protein